jgi:hypothetical protein
MQQQPAALQLCHWCHTRHHAMRKNPCCNTHKVGAVLAASRRRPTLACLSSVVGRLLRSNGSELLVPPVGLAAGRPILAESGEAILAESGEAKTSP